VTLGKIRKVGGDPTQPRPAAGGGRLSSPPAGLGSLFLKFLSFRCRFGLRPDRTGFTASGVFRTGRERGGWLLGCPRIFGGLNRDRSPQPPVKKDPGGQGLEGQDQQQGGAGPLGPAGDQLPRLPHDCHRYQQGPGDVAG
jgi:hypothetical protein